MPTYEFRCPKGHEFEKFYRSISGAPLEVACPTCGLIAERQMSGGAGLVFKGSGFYITDYGKDGKKDQTPRAESSSSTGESATAASSDSKSSGDSKSSPAPKPSEPVAPAPKQEPKKSKGKEKSSE